MPNIIIETGGATASVATDVAQLSGITTNFQIFKLGYGVTGSISLVTSSNPLPVYVGTTLSANITGFSGPMSIQGVASGTPVVVSGTVIVSGTTGSAVYVKTFTGSQVEVTGGRYRDRTTDSISVYGPSGSTFIYANLVSSVGVAVGTVSNPIYANIIGATISATIPSLVTVTGLSGATAIGVNVGNTVGINDTAILAGMTVINSQVIGMRTDLQALGVGRATAFKTGRSSLTSASATQMDSAGYTCYAGINIRAISTNTDFVYLGNSSGLVGASGYALDPGENVFLNIQNTNKVYAISNTGTQVITYMAS
jgi:hypothetical protein